MSTNTGLKPHWITEAMSETQVRVGTMTSPGPKVSRRAAIVSRLAEEPELTKTLCLTPSQADHSCSNSRTWRGLGEHRALLAEVLDERVQIGAR